MADRSFSHAIAEGDGISVIAAVDDRRIGPSRGSRSAPKPSSCAAIRRAVREATVAADPLARRRPVRARPPRRPTRYLLVFDSFDDDDGQLEQLHQPRDSRSGSTAPSRCATRKSSSRRSNASTRRSSCCRRPRATTTRTPLEVVLDLLAAVPAGKLAIADLPLTTPDEVQELEHAGCDAVIVHGRRHRRRSPAARRPRSDRIRRETAVPCPA